MTCNSFLLDPWYRVSRLSQWGASEVHPETSKAFPPVFRTRSFTQGCHWPAVLPGKDGTAALACCWRAARLDGFQLGWSQELPRRPHCLPFWPTRARGRRDPLLGRVGRHQSWGMAASGRQGCSCCHAGSWCAHADREQHHWEVPSPSSQAAAIAAAASVHQPRAVQQQRCHSGYLAREAKKHPPLCVARGRDGALPGCRWTGLTGLRQVLALDCHQASRWLMALSLCQEALCLPGPSLSS